MIAIIQCAGSKQADATSLSLHGATLAFCAQPDGECDVRPWDRVPELGGTWIDSVRALNGIDAHHTWSEYEAAGVAVEAASRHLYAAAEIYTPRSIPNPYQALADAVGGSESLYILSAGWGLVRGDRWIPVYDVTFQSRPRVHVDPAHRSRKQTVESSIPGTAEIHLFLSSKYLDYWNLTFGQAFNHRSILHWRKQQGEPPRIPARNKNCERHDCPGATNWQYQAVKQFLASA